MIIPEQSKENFTYFIFTGGWLYVIINAADKAKELGNAKVMNIILLGALVKSMSLEDIDWESIIRENIKEKFVDINLQAFKKGMETVSEEAFPLKSN